jgi:hypothetical protein
MRPDFSVFNLAVSSEDTEAVIVRKYCAHTCIRANFGHNYITRIYTAIEACHLQSPTGHASKVSEKCRRNGPYKSGLV